MDYLLLEDLMRSKGLTFNKLAAKTGIKSSSLTMKIHEKRVFDAAEIHRISYVLGLSAEERDKIFFDSSS